MAEATACSMLLCFSLSCTMMYAMTSESVVVWNMEPGLALKDKIDYFFRPVAERGDVGNHLSNGRPRNRGIHFYHNGFVVGIESNVPAHESHQRQIMLHPQIEL